MAYLRQIAIILCALFIVVAVLEALLPEKDMLLVIKWVVLLYIIAAVIAPIKNFAPSMLLSSFNAKTADNTGVQESLLSQSEEIIASRIGQALEIGGILGADVAVHILSNEKEVGVDKVYISGIDNINHTKISEIVNTTTGTVPEIIYD